MSWSYNNGVITQSGRDYDLSGLAGSITTDDFTLIESGTPSAVQIKAQEKLSSSVTLTGNGSSDIDALITAHNSANAGSEVVLASGDGGQKLESGQTIVIPAGMTGVEVKRDAYSSFSSTGPSEVVTYIVDEDTRITIKGTVFHDPEVEILYLRHEWTSGFQPALQIGTSTAWGAFWLHSWERDSEGRLVAVFNNTEPIDHSTPFAVGDVVCIRNAEDVPNNTPYPVADVTSTSSSTRITLEGTQYDTHIPSSTYFQGTHGGRLFRHGAYNYGKYTEGYGRKRASNATGLIITGKPQNYYQGDGGGLYVGSNGGLIGRGGSIMSSRLYQMSGVLDLIDTTLAGTCRMDSRGIGGGRFRNVKFLKTQASGWQSGRITERGLVLQESTLMEVLADPFFELVLKDFDASLNIKGTDIAHSPDNGYRHRDWIIVNSANGSNVRGMWRQGAGSQKGNVFVKKEVSFNFEDVSGNPLSGVELYLQDNPSDYAKNATFTEPSNAAHKYTQADYTDKQNGETLGVLNSDGTVTYDYSGAITYSGTSDAQGNIDTIRVLTAATILEYNSGSTHATAAANDYPGLEMNSSGTWRTLNPTTYPALEDWDTDKWGGFYKVDRRSDSNTDADDFTFKFCSYGHALASSTQELKGLGELEVNWVLFNDSSITEPSKSLVDGYTEIETPEKFYDRAKSFLTDDYAGETSTIVSREGSTVNIGSYNLDVDANATAVFAFDGSKITIKASTFVGNITTTGGTIRLLNDAEIVGTYGDISVLPFTITNVIAGSTVQLYNVSNDGNEISNTVVTGTAGTKVTYSGTYANSLADADDEVRLRITCAAADGAFLPYESFGVATAAGISFKANQVADTVYNDNAIDGSATNYDSASLTITPDYSNFELDVSDSDNPGSVTVQQIYAKYAYLITTTDGIDKFFGAITAENTSNYRINTDVADLKIQNISSSDMIITGARLYRDDNTTVIKKGPASAGTLSHDTGEFLQYIQPQVEAALNGYGVLGPDDLNAVKKNTNLIPGLL